MTRLVDDLLDVSRITQGKVESEKGTDSTSRRRCTRASS